MIQQAVKFFIISGGAELPIASVSKLITVYIVLDEIKQHKISWNTPIPISNEVAELSHNKKLTNVPLQAGETYTVRQLYLASMISSANGAAMALGQYISKDNFGSIMSNTVSKMGIKNYKLYNACGLTNRDLGPLKDPKIKDTAKNKMSAVGVAQLSQKLINKYPEIINASSLKQIHWLDKVYPNTNLLLGKDTPFKIDGLKTGTSRSAGENFVGTGEGKNHSRVITVILGAPKGQRFIQTQLLLKKISHDLIPVRVNNEKMDKTYWIPRKYVDPINSENMVLNKLSIAPGDKIALLPGNKISRAKVHKKSSSFNIRKLIIEISILLIFLIIVIRIVHKFNRKKYKGKHFK